MLLSYHGKSCLFIRRNERVVRYLLHEVDHLVVKRGGDFFSGLKEIGLGVGAEPAVLNAPKLADKLDE